MIWLFAFALLAAALAMPAFIAAVLGFVAWRAAKDESLDRREEEVAPMKAAMDGVTGLPVLIEDREYEPGETVYAYPVGGDQASMLCVVTDKEGTSVLSSV